MSDLRTSGAREVVSDTYELVSEDIDSLSESQELLSRSYFTSLRGDKSPDRVAEYVKNIFSNNVFSDVDYSSANVNSEVPDEIYDPVVGDMYLLMCGPSDEIGDEDIENSILNVQESELDKSDFQNLLGHLRAAAESREDILEGLKKEYAVLEVYEDKLEELQDRGEHMDQLVKTKDRAEEIIQQRRNFEPTSIDWDETTFNDIQDFTYRNEDYSYPVISDALEIASEAEVTMDELEESLDRQLERIEEQKPDSHERGVESVFL